MTKLNVAPTKSSYLTLSRQLDSAKEGYDLLDQKRQILVYELMSRLGRARDAERRLAAALAPAHEALREAVLDVGSGGVDRAALGVAFDHQIELDQQNLMAIPKTNPKITAVSAPQLFTRRQRIPNRNTAAKGGAKKAYNV